MTLFKELILHIIKQNCFHWRNKGRIYTLWYLWINKKEEEEEDK